MPDQRALLELVDQLGNGWRPREPGIGDSVAVARDTLAESGVWALGLPEADGGGGADHETVQLAIARVATYWPALGLAMAHLHAAGVALSGDERLAVAAGGRPIAVVLVTDPPDQGVGVPRVDVGASHCDLVLVHAEHCWFVAADRVRFGVQSRRTGLDGALTRPAEVLPGAAVEIGADADSVRGALNTGALAVAAGLVFAASEHAREYAAGRVQFGAPLTALPTMRDQLSTLRGQAVTMLSAARQTPISAHDAATLRNALDTAVDVGSAAVQCLGGYGYLEEYPVAGMFRDAVSLRAAAHVGVPEAV